MLEEQIVQILKTFPDWMWAVGLFIWLIKDGFVAVLKK